MGRANARVLGLQKGDKLSDIKDSSFFANRLANKFNLPLSSEYDPKLYDAVLYQQDGTPLLVVMGDVQTKLDRLDGCIPNPEYTVNSDGFIEYNGKELFESGGKAFFKSADGKYDIMVVDGPEAFKDVLDSRQHSMVRYNYNPSNWKTLVEFQNPTKFKNGILNSSFTFNGININQKNIDDPSVAIDLMQKEESSFANRISKLALKQYYAFKAQLSYILARIPSQSMQSFMDVDVTLWIESELNEVYVPRALTFIQGSDYDIDKDYMMGFGLLPDGTLPTLSDLENEINPQTGVEYSPYDILALHAPEGRKFIARNLLFGRKSGISNDDINAIKSDITKLNKVLDLRANKDNTVTVFFNSNVSQEDRNFIIDLVNKHEQSKRYGNRELVALQNTVVRGMLEVLGMPDTQINMSNPISMDDLKAVAKKTTLAKDEQIMTLDDIGTKFKMQEQNMVGREVIGIGAVSLKHFFEASTFFNKQLQEIEQDIEDYERTGLINSEQLVQNVIDLCFDEKFTGNVITLANLDFRKVKLLLFSNPRLKDITVNKNLRTEYSESGKDGLFNIRFDEDGNEYRPFIEIDGEKSIVHLEDLIKYLDVQSNGTWDSPIDAAFALSQLISAATDNAKELILSKINATTKFADVWTYLMTTGMRISEIADIMTSPLFNVVAYYAQSNIYDQQNVSLEDSLKFILNKQTLYRKLNGKFTTLLTYVGNTNPGTVTSKVDDFKNSFLLRLCCESNVNGDPIFEGSSYKQKPNNLLVRWYQQYVLPEGNSINNITVDDIIDKIKNINRNRWNSEKYDYNQDYKDLLNFIYSELQSSNDAQQTLLTLLSNNITDSTTYEVFDPEILLFQEDAFFDDPDLIPDEYGSDVEEGAEDYNGTLDTSSARTFYRYAKGVLIPKMAKTGTISIKDINNMNILLEKVLPAMKEQQINGQILGINQGLKTNAYEEWNWIRKIENFVNQRYIQSDLENPQQFNLLEFLRNPEYQKRQIDQYEKVKSTVNILKAVLSAPNYNAMLKIVGSNRKAIERAAVIRIENDLADKVLAEAKTKAKSANGTGISTGYFYKLNQKEYKALEYAVSDALILNFLKSLKGYEINVPIGQSYYNVDGKPVTSIDINIGNIKFNSSHEIASFKRLMEEYIIPKLIERYGDNEFFANLTTGFKRDVTTGMPITFYKLSFNISDIEKSPKLQGLYDNVAKGFNSILYRRIDQDILSGDWTIGDLFYMYNLIVHKDAIGGDSFTRLFDELAASGNKFSLVNAYRDFLGRIDSGDLRWKESSRTGNVIQYGAAVAIDLRDIRYRCCLTDDAEMKFRVKRDKNSKGKITKIHMRGTDKKVTDSYDTIDLSAINRNDYTLNLPYFTKSNVSTSSVVTNLQTDVDIKEHINSTEVLTAIVNQLRNRVGTRVPIHIITNNDLESGTLPFKIDSRMQSAVGFMINGNIYINPDNFRTDIKDDIGAPVHELMHIVCAAMKYGNNAQRSLYYKMLDEIDKGDEKWKEFYNELGNNYNVVGSDLKEEILIRALTKAFVDDFTEEWNSRGSITLGNIENVVRNILEELLAVEFEGSTKISDILKAPLGQVMAVFNSQFEGASSQYTIKTIIPTNQRIAKLKINLVKNNKLNIGDNC